MAESSCCCNANDVMVFACSGGSNVGQVANRAAMQLDQEGRARMYCLAGVTPHLDGMVAGAQSAGFRVAIDGCPIACAKEGLTHAGLQIDQYVVMTDLGIEKEHNFLMAPADVERVVSAVRNGLPGGA